MSFTPAYSSLTSLFADHSLEIPPFQRSYVWEQENINKFLDDILEAYKSGEKTTYFIGTVIAVPADDRPGVYDVIDGQQRLTTLFLLLATLTKSGSSLNLEQFFEQYGGKRPRFTNATNDEAREIFIKISEDPLGELDRTAAIAPEDLTPHQVGLTLVNNWAAENKKDALTREFFYFIATKVRFISIFADSYGDAVDLFERINNDGKSLSTGDLLKNFFLRASADKTNEGRRMLCRTWDSIEKYKMKPQGVSRAIIGKRDGIDGFIQKACEALVWPQDEKLPTKASLFKKIKDFASPKPGEPYISVEVFLNSIKAYADGAKNLYSKATPLYTNGTSGVALSRLMQFYRVPDWALKLLLSMPRSTSDLSTKAREEFTKALELLMVIVALGGDSKDLNKRVQKYCVQLRTSTDANIANIAANLLSDAAIVTISESEIARLIENLEVSSKKPTHFKIAKHILLMLDNWLALRIEPTCNPDMAELTVEHIIPQCKAVDTIYRIGNTCLLKGRSNSSAQDKSFAEKLKVYQHSTLLTARLLSSGTSGLPAKTQKEFSDLGLQALWEHGNSFGQDEVNARTKLISKWFLTALEEARTQKSSQVEAKSSHEPGALVNPAPNDTGLFEVGDIIYLEIKGPGGNQSGVVEIVPGIGHTPGKLGIHSDLANKLQTFEEGAWHNYVSTAPSGSLRQEVRWVIR